MSTELFSCWKESLSFVRWSNFKLLFAATLNNAYRSARIVIKYFWPHLLISIAFFAYGLQHINFFDRLMNSLNAPAASTQEIHTPFNHLLIIALILFLYSSLCFLFQLATRPSLERKDFHYFLLYLSKSLPLIPLSIFLTGLNYLLSFSIGSMLSLLFATSPFFYLDAPSTIASFIASIKRSMKLFLYFFPGIVLSHMLISLIITIFGVTVSLTSYFLKFLPTYLMQTGLFVLLGTIFLVYSMISTSFFAMLYTKIKHSNPSIFF